MAALALKTVPARNLDAYAVLAVDAALPDRAIGDLISRLPSDLASGYISESTQWVFLDNFGSLEQVALDSCAERLEDFDPRNDGYGEKLRAFFVRGGKRLFFIPLPAERLDTPAAKFGIRTPPDLGRIPVSDTWANRKRFAALERGLGASLGAVPFSLEFLVIERPLACYLLLFALAASGAVILSDSPRVTAALLPVLGPLALAGPPGFAVGAALLGLLPGAVAALCREARADSYGSGVLYAVTLCLWFGMFWNTPGVFSAAGAGMLGRADRAALTLLGISAALCVSALLLLGARSESKRGPRRTALPCTLGAVPFVLVSLMALYIPSVKNEATEGGGAGATDSRYFVDAAEYESHLAFQSSFSFVPLGTVSPADRSARAGYARYRLGEDGLIADADRDALPAPQGENPAAPPFPLAGLIAFLTDFKYTAGTPPYGGTGPVNPLLALLAVMLLVFHVPRVSRRALSEDRTKRITA